MSKEQITEKETIRNILYKFLKMKELFIFIRNKWKQKI